MSDGLRLAKSFACFILKEFKTAFDVASRCDRRPPVVRHCSYTFVMYKLLRPDIFL